MSRVFPRSPCPVLLSLLLRIRWRLSTRMRRPKRSHNIRPVCRSSFRICCLERSLPKRTPLCHLLQLLPPTSRTIPSQPEKIVSPPVSSMLDDEELKIPSWLEPLARNAPAPNSTQELVEREKA